MSASNAVRFLANASGSDPTSLGLKMFFGSVVEAFRTKSFLFNPGVNVIAKKMVTAGKSWQFLMMADTDEAEDHTPGNELLGQPYALDEGTITVDDYVVAHHDVPTDQLKIAHFDVLGPLGQKVGYQLARKYDRRLFQTAVTAYRTAAVTKNGLTVHNGGNVIRRSGSAAIATAYPATPTGAQALRDDLAELAYEMDLDFVPEEDRYLILHTHFRRVLTRDVGYVWGTPTNTAIQGASSLFSKDFGSTGNDVNSRKVFEIEGFKILGFANFQSQNGSIPDTNIATGPSKYQVNCVGSGSSAAKPVAIALCGASNAQAAIGMVTFGGIEPFIGPDERRNTTFLKAQILCGADKMHVWNAGAVEIHA